MGTTEASLEDPAYDPRYKPVNGQPPEVVAKWGPRSQVRWFNRFSQGMWLSCEEWNRFYVHSEQHRGLCRSSCEQDEDWNGYANFDEACCCRGYREQKGD